MERYSTWQIVKTGERSYLKREKLPRVDGKIKWESYKGSYDSADREAVEALKRRLNATYEQRKKEAEKRYDFDHAYISKRIQDLFEQDLRRSITDEDRVVNLMYHLRTHIFGFFVLTKETPSPVDWRKHEGAWGEYLQGLKLGHSAMTRPVQVINRFLNFLRIQFPEEVPFIKMSPIPPKTIRLMEKEVGARMRDGRYYITDTHWNFIKKHIAPEIKEHVLLAEAFGFRRAETMGLLKVDFKKGYILCQRQLISLPEPEKPEYGPLKDVEPRKVPYWFMEGLTALSLVTDMKLYHPDTLGNLFCAEMARLQAKYNELHPFDKLTFEYTFHDLRRRFLTKAVKAHGREAVRLAAGHEDPATLNIYVQDDRELEDQPLTL